MANRLLRIGLACAWLLCTSLSTGGAWAQTGADKAAAEALFDQARTLADEGKYDQACDKFEASQQLDPALGTLLHLADCYEKANRLASAWATFEEAASLARTRGENERAQIASVRAAALKPQLIQVMIKVPDNAPEGLEVRRNGRIIPEASYGVPVPVDEGTWTITASAPGHQSFEASVDVKSGSPEPYVVNIPKLAADPKPTTAAPAPEPAPSPPETTPPAEPRDVTSSDDGSGQRTLAYIIGGAGLASAIVSGVFTALAAGNNSDSEKLCEVGDPNECSAEGKRLRDDALTQASIATVTGIVGAVGIAGGATLYFTAGSGNSGSANVGLQLKGNW